MKKHLYDTYQCAKIANFKRLICSILIIFYTNKLKRTHTFLTKYVQAIINPKLNHMKKPNSVLLQKFLFVTGIILLMQFQAKALCNAGFTYTINSNTKTVTFTNTSTGTGTYSLWYFGDNTSSTQTNPVKTYSNYGTYYVCLYAHDSAWSCFDSVCTTVTITNTCNAEFNNIADTGNYKKIYFTSLNAGSNLTYKWTFGDGDSSVLQSPTHIYTNAGTYNVCLIVRKSYNGDTCINYTCHSVVVAPVTCRAAFTYSINHYTRVVTFTNTSIGTGLGYSWKFGDSTTSALKDPVKTYSNYGTYTVCLKIFNISTGCLDSICTTVTIYNQCIASFTEFADNVNPKKITFFGSPVVGIITFKWTFGDGDSSVLMNPIHIYTNAGTYNVCFFVRKYQNGDTCVSSTCHSVAVSPACSAYFSHLNSGTKTVNFTNYSLGSGLSYYWKFGDSTFSTLANPVKTYSNYGTYNVCLFISSGNCMDSFCKTVSLYSGTNACNTDFIAYADSSNRKMFHFNAQNSGANLNYYWTFGDTGTSTLKSPNHTYAYYGTYTVSLRVSKAYNGDTCSNLGYINIPVTGLCNANFFYTTDSANNKKRNFKPYLAYASNTSYYWNFGDSSTSTLYNPGHIFSNAGVYNVCLNVIQHGPNQYDTCFKKYCTSVTIGCKAQYSYTIDAANKLKVYFNNVSTGSGLTYNWTFGNSTTSTLKNPQVTYATAGTYTVCLTIHSTVDTSCSETKCLNITVFDTSACHAQFLFIRDTTNVLRVQFNNTSTGDSLISTWNFGDGSANSNVRNPDHTFPAAGTYYVCMNVSRSNPSCSSYKCDSVTVGSNPSTCTSQFYYSVNSVTRTVVFANVSTGSRLKYSWGFGDSTTSALKNPVHVFANNGTYPVCLYVFDSSNINCNDMHCVNISIMGSGTNCTANFGHHRDTLTSVLKYYFVPVTNFSPTNTSFTWTFGDGDSAMTKSPSHIYAATGTYTVCLTVHNVGDSCLVSRCDSIAVYNSSGIAEQQNWLEHAKFYPNPFDENINIELHEANAGKLNISIYDITGREHYNSEFVLNPNQNHFVIATTHLPKGVYLLRLKSEGSSFIKKLIK